jgi:branched-chain amino acid transport system ATP-binding protein
VNGSGEASYLLEGRDLHVSYGGVRAVDGVNISLRSGFIYGIVGQNGSGKSTLLAALTRFVNLTSGSMLIDGTDYHRDPATRMMSRGLARTFQSVRLIDELTVEENVLLGADAVTRAGARERAGSALEQTNLTSLSRQRVDSLPYGTQRRVEIARAIASEPRLLMLDEPTAGMNHTERDEIAALLRELKRDGMTQLVVEHDVQMMVHTCDFLYAMDFGRVIAFGAPEDVVRVPAVQLAYLGKVETDA